MRTEDELERLTVAEALESRHWREAIERDHQSLIHNITWKLVLLPPNRIVVNGKWCYWAKINAGGTIQWHKARYVA